MIHSRKNPLSQIPSPRKTMMKSVRPRAASRSRLARVGNGQLFACVLAIGASLAVAATASAAPANDHFASAQAISSASGTVSGTNFAATKEAGEPAHAANPGGASVWYFWTAPQSGVVAFDTIGSDFDTLLAVYTGSAVNNLTEIAVDDDGGGGRTSRAAFNAIGGTVYMIVVDGFDAAAGSIVLSWRPDTLANPPPNDDFASAQAISSASGTVSGTNVAATKQAGEPRHAGNAGGKSVWYSWTAPQSGVVAFDTIGSDFDTLLAVYTGSAVNNLTEIAANDDGGGGRTSRAAFNAIAGTVYMIAVDGYNAAAGSIVLSWPSDNPPPNRNFANYEPYSFTTLAGVAPSTDKSADGTGSAAQFWSPNGVAVDGAGNVYVADLANATIRKITPSGVVSTLAGLAGSRGSADGTGCAARFSHPAGVAVDGAGNVYVADRSNDIIRKITPSGVVSTLAGLAGSAGSVDGTGSEARFSDPTGVTVDGAGNVYVADFNNHTIRKITPSGVVSTLAGLAVSFGSADGTGNDARFFYPSGVAVDGASNVYVGDRTNGTIRKITPSGVVSTLAGLARSSGSVDGTGSEARFSDPTGVTVDGAGNVYVADTRNSTIRKITAAGVVTTLAGLARGFESVGGSVDGTGSEARFSGPTGVTVDGAGNVYVADTFNDTIRKITPSGVVTTVAGLAVSFGIADGTGSAARFSGPTGVTVDGAGNVYVADGRNATIRKITPPGVVTTLAGLPGARGIADGIGSSARFFSPTGVAADGAGNVYVVDSSTIRKITPSGTVSTLAGLAGSFGSDDGTGSDARFHSPYGVAVDGAGNVYVTDGGVPNLDGGNHTIRKITAAGVVSTLAGSPGSRGSADGAGSAARFSYPTGVAVDGAGNVYVADGGNATIRKITPSGVVSTLAGVAGSRGSGDGSGSAARFSYPAGVAVDGAGNAYVADTSFDHGLSTAGNHTIRKITAAGVVTTLAGLAGSFGSADGTGSVARFTSPDGVAVDGAGNVYVGDSRNNTIRIGLPVSASITTVGQSFVYQIEASGTNLLSVNNLPPGLAFDSEKAAITGVPSQAGTFVVEVADADTRTPLTIIVQPEAPAASPVITSSTTSTGRLGRAFSFQVLTAGGSPAARLSASGLPQGLALDSLSGVISGDATAAGSYIVRLTLSDGDFTAVATLQLIFTSIRGLPVIISPRSALLTPGQPFTYTLAADGCAAGDSAVFDLVGDLPPGLTFDRATATISGVPTPPGASEGRGKPLSAGIVTNVTAFASNSVGTAGAELPFFFAPTGVVNISTRLAVHGGENVLIGGFIVTGNAPKKMIIRAIGPSLGRANGGSLDGVLNNPRLRLLERQNELGSNENWRDNEREERAIMDTDVPPRDDREAALVAVLNPGSYTAIVSSTDGGPGVGLVELYDLGTASIGRSATAKVANISTRGFVQTGNDVMIGGFIVSDRASKVIVRAIGPSLSAAGVSAALQDPTLDLVNGNGSVIVSNNDWRSGGQEQQVIDTTVPPTDDRESAIVATLNPGPYTAVVRGKDSGTGVALVEVYVLQ